MTHQLRYYSTGLPKLSQKDRRKARALVNSISRANLLRYSADELLLAVYYTGLEHGCVLTESQIQNTVGQGAVLRGNNDLAIEEYRLVHSQSPRPVRRYKRSVQQG